MRLVFLLMKHISIIVFQILLTNYHEISSYLELNGTYLHNMAIFDDAWELYTIHKS